MLTPEQEEIDRTIRRLAPDRSAARRALEGGPGVDPVLWAKLAELGMIGMGLPEAKGGVEYQKCGGVYYRSAFQGNNLVYVAQ